MYSWGSDTSTWKGPGKYDYGDAMKPYLDKLEEKAESERIYSKKKGPDLKIVEPKNREITTESENPILIAVDGTGSMQKWPAEIFDRLPLLYQTLSKYKDGIEMSFSVIGDAKSDQWPTQISNFGKGPTLDDFLKGLSAEGGGGPGIRESYELWAYFVHQHVKTPKATSPFMIVMGDEMFYNVVDPKEVNHYLGETIQAPIDSMGIWKALGQKFDIYLLRKSYEPHDDQIKAQWAEAIGEQKIIPVYDPLRVVDVAMGLISKQWGQFGDFSKNLSARQDGKNIETVMESLRVAPGLPEGMKSIVKGGTTSKKSKSLIGGKK